LEVNVAYAAQLKIGIYNQLGQLEMMIPSEQRSIVGANFYTINLSKLSKGLKFIRVESENLAQTLPILLN
jgi:hypothetical protein